jgi:hypothetical protein
MRTEDSFRLRSMISALAALMIASALPATAAELKVANNGADSATCGSQTSPCRSISQAIENASDGDTIQVGAGRYGSVSGDVNFGGPGDEHPMGVLLEGGGPGGCILCITKAVQLYSIHGASVTVIAGIPGTPFGSNVMILADGVVFGAKDHGFTITGGNSNGLTIALPNPNSTITASIVRGTTVAGNVDIGDTTGFYFFGRPIPGARDCPPGDCVLTGQTLLSDNRSIGNTTGFNFLLNTDLGPGQVIVRNNLTIGAGTGFAVDPGYMQCQGCYEPISAGIVQLIENVAANGNVGFSTNLAGPIEGNTASSNAEAGFIVFSPIQETFKSNSAIGNGGPGVIVNFSPDVFTVVPSNSGFATFGENNFFGNDRNRPAIFLSMIGPGSPGINPGPSAHCGVLNVGALAALLVLPPPSPSPVIVLQAGNNFWGSKSGPQPNGPGDSVGDVCDQNGGVTVAKPAAATYFAITSWP